MRKLRIGTATVNQTPLDWEGNKNNIIEAINDAIQSKINLLCFPELCITGYGCEDLFLSNWFYKRAEKTLLEIIPYCKQMLVVIPLPIKYDSKNYNAALIIEDCDLISGYAKQNLANDGVHYEKRWFNPWKRGKIVELQIGNKSINFGDITYQYKKHKIGFEICEDAWKKDRPAEKFDDIDLIMNPSASHFSFGKSLLRRELVTKSSKKYNCTYIYSNLLGNEAGRIIFDGEMMIAKDGVLLNHNKILSFKSHEVIYYDISSIKHESIIKDTYFGLSKNEEFLNATTLGLFDYLRKSKAKGYTVSLSGGADSSTISVLLSQMIKRGVEELGVQEFLKKINLKIDVNGSNNAFKIISNKILNFVYQTTVNSTKKTFHSAKTLAKEINATFYKWSVDDEINSFTKTVENTLKKSLNWENNDITLQNIQARTRSPIIWMLANINNHILISTSNRSEASLGYVTMDGDTCGAIAPIGGVDKAFILNWLKWAEKKLNYSSLIFVNNLNPSAELRPKELDQKDEKDLMPYSIISRIERLAIKEYLSPKEVYNELKKENLEENKKLKSYIVKFYTLWSKNQWKRERLAPAFHLDDFNIDPKTWYRFPILNNNFEEELKDF